METSWARMEALFHDALALPPSERAAFVQKHCAGDSELYEEVMGLLKHAEPNTDLNHIVSVAAEDLLRNDQRLQGKQLGRYRLTRFIDRGGMGVVYKAERADDQYQKLVAIKLMRKAFSTEFSSQRFKQERQNLANLEHANIARLIDGGSTDEGLPYLVMEYIDGKPLHTYCEHNRLTPSQRLGLFRKICAAVTYAHQQLIVHCDLKMSNILVDSDGEPKLLDFGISRLLSEVEERSATGANPQDQQMYTLRYSSPEQIKGGPITTATDVYALGVILFELMTGAQPYKADEDDAAAYRQAILTLAPSIPSASVINQACNNGKSSHGHRRIIRGELDSIVLKALQKSPEQRYPSVAALMQDIDDFVGIRPVSAHSAGPWYVLSKYLCRNSISAALFAILLLSLAGFMQTILSKNQQVTTERDRAEAVLGFIREMFEEISPARTQGQEVTVRYILDRASENIIAKRKPDTESSPAVEGIIHKTLGRIYLSLGDISSAEEHLNRALTLMESHRLTDNQEYLAILQEVSRMLAMQFQYNERAEDIDRRAFELSRKLHGERSALTLGMKSTIASGLHNRGELKQAEKMFESILADQREVLGQMHPDTLASINDLGITYHWLGKYTKAEEYYRLCIEGMSKVRGENHPDTIRCISNLGSVLESSGQYQQAEPVISRHIELASRILGPHHPETLRSMHNLADTYRGLTRFDESETLFMQTLELRIEKLGDEHIETLQTKMKLARLLRQLGRYQKALPLVSDAMQIKQQQLGFGHPTTLRVAQERAELLEVMDQSAEAEQLYLRILAATEEKLSDNHPDLLATLSGLARVSFHRSESDQADRYLQRAVALTDIHQNLNIAPLAATLREFIRYYQKEGSSEIVRPYRETLQRLLAENHKG
jgi:eukaryotic-like serine/threonine-protein kinase